MSIILLIDGEGFPDLEVISPAANCEVRRVVEEIAARRGWRNDEVLLFVEDADEALVAEAIIDLESASRRVHHAHRLHRVSVTIRYKNLEKTREFAPSARVQRVLDWAVSKEGFNIDISIAPEMELAISGSDQPLVKSSHIGRYVEKSHKSVALDLIRGVVPNGC